MHPNTCIRYNKIVYQNNNGQIVEILPKDSHVSFYGKAHALFTPFYTALFSYKTPILVYKIATPDAPAEFIKLYNGGYFNTMRLARTSGEFLDKVSPTTMRHITAFCGMGRGEFMSLPFSLGTQVEWYDRIDADSDGWRYK